MSCFLGHGAQSGTTPPPNDSKPSYALPTTRKFWQRPTTRNLGRLIRASGFFVGVPIRTVCCMITTHTSRWGNCDGIERYQVGKKKHRKRDNVERLLCWDVFRGCRALERSWIKMATDVSEVLQGKRSSNGDDGSKRPLLWGRMSGYGSRKQASGRSMESGTWWCVRVNVVGIQNLRSCLYRIVVPK